ncbi:zinc ribbon domain-containing protein [Oceanirhabdus sp. W0125-5]|uniref:zinc ribbon domain-containing protein n=1 Tax=Oceanirhabdus sp. W0125-5 TaxID=2999116 RepID=UPI0022F2FA3F|nr:zinc ribbon domain-containing protein [Oceanirhabdus sp. W0125-5]WBW98424.1 zinc ribbon domain-containing protein [Oceanirhabdus sp. W0125-5]
MNEKNFPFKTLFIVLMSILGLLILGGSGLFIFAAMNDPFFPEIMYLVMVLVFILAIGLLSVISTFIYKDAPKHNMDPWMWMCIAVFVPNLLGLLIYLIVRSDNKTPRVQCISCGNKVNEEYNICPYCGNSLNCKCTECGTKISPNWIICPKCGSETKKDVK